MEQSTTVDIAAPPERVWEVLADVERSSDWTKTVELDRRARRTMLHTFVRLTLVAPTVEAVPAPQTGNPVPTSPRRTARATAWAGSSIGVGSERDDRIVIVWGDVLWNVRTLRHDDLSSMTNQ